MPATAILAALRPAATTGAGQQIDMALMDVAVSIMANQAMNYLATGTAPPRWATRIRTSRPTRSSTAADGYIIIATGNDGQYRRLCEMLGVARDGARRPNS